MKAETHDGSPITVMGGILSRAEQWRNFERADKDECGQLMMADFAAHSEYIMEKRGIDTGVPRNRPTIAVPRGMTGSNHYQLTPEMLRKLRAEIVERATPKKSIPDTNN